MHEMALAENLLELALAEARKAGCDRLLAARVEYGPLAGIMPEALALCFEAVAREAGQQQARLTLVALPLLLRCPFCQAEFGGKDRDAIWQPCPQCGGEFGHIVLQGRELVLARIEAARSTG